MRAKHDLLVKLKNVKDNSGKLLRWFVRLREFYFELERVLGKDNVVADAYFTNAIAVMGIRLHEPDIPTRIRDLIKWGTAEDTRGVDWQRTSGVMLTERGSYFFRVRVRKSDPIYVPKKGRESVLKYCHDARGHTGIVTTIELIRRALH